MSIWVSKEASTYNSATISMSKIETLILILFLVLWTDTTENLCIEDDIYVSDRAFCSIEIRWLKETHNN